MGHIHIELVATLALVGWDTGARRQAPLVNEVGVAQGVAVYEGAVAQLLGRWTFDIVAAHADRRAVGVRLYRGAAHP